MAIAPPLENETSGPRRITLASILLALCCVIPYVPALRGGFVFDDQGLIVAPLTQAEPFRLVRVLTTPYWALFQEGLLWRPVTSLTLDLDWRIGGGGPFLFHLVNLLLHTGVTFLWVSLVRRLTGRDSLALLSGMFFAVHPLHTEAVAWISGRAELLAAAFGLAALRLYWSGDAKRRWLAPLCVLLAAGSKESAAVAPALMLYTAWAVEPAGWRRRIPVVLASLGSVVLYLLLRRAVLGTWAGPAPLPVDNPMVGLGFFSRLPTVLDVAGRYVWLLFWPARLSTDYSAPVLDVVRGLTPFLLLGLASGAGLVWLALRRRADAAGWGAGFALVSFALASNLLVVIGTIMGERLFYLPSAGLLLLIAAGVQRAPARVPRRWVWGAVIIALLACSARTWSRSLDYRDDFAHSLAGVRAAPRSLKMHSNLALNLNHRGRYEESVREAEAALGLDPRDRQARDILASSLERAGRPAEAIAFLLRAVASDPLDATARRRLCGLLDLQGARARADSVAEAGLREDAGNLEWITRSARAAQSRQEFARAIELWRSAVARAPDSTGNALALAYCLLRRGETQDAREVYGGLVRRAPQSAEAANGLAWTLLETGGPPAEAVTWAQRAVSLQPSAPNYDTLARALLAAGHFTEALDAANHAAGMEVDNPEYRALVREIRGRAGSSGP